MPAPLLIPAIAAGASLLGQGVNAYAQGKMNKKTREWNEKMYGVQRKDALADWQMQTAYNTPAAQMQRLKDAGLNPNLVYGNGADASNASPVRSTDVKGWNPQAPQFDPGSVMGQFVNIQGQQLDQDRVRAQLELLEQEKKNKIAEEVKTYADVALRGSQRDLTDTNVQLKGVDLNYATKFKEISYEAAKAAVEKTRTDTKLSEANIQYRLSENERATLRNNQSIAESAVRILRMRQEMLLKTEQRGYDRQKWSQQIQEIEERINKIRSDTKGSNERARLLQSTPDWGDQRSIEMLQSLLGGATKSGTYFNPRTYSGWRK